MAKRSLKVLEKHFKKTENAFITLGLTQNALAQRLNISRSTVSNFLRGKPIYKENFVKICETLKLDWQEITGLKAKKLIESKDTEDVNELVTQLRQQVKADIKTRCGTMRIFDMSQPIELGKIYTQVNILEKISSYQRKNIAELFKNCRVEDIDRFNLGAVREERIPGKEAVSRHKKLLILGKPGAGKTTFLKHLAIQCNRGEFREDLVPFFVTLKEFAEDEHKRELLAYLDPLKSLFVRENNQNSLGQILANDKALILLDGLDEVLEADTKRVIREIESLTNRYPENQYLMTCRIAAKEYTFEKFTEVEIADFDDEQIATFAENWFKDKPVKSETFLERLRQDKPIEELVSNPLLLTLLCISFEELGDFPANRKELYEEGIDALLKKWDAKQGVQRDKVYKPLSIAKKEDLLSKIAWETFKPGDYFFKQDKAERLISEYIRNLPGANLDDEALQGDSEIVLKNIEAQHGLLVARAKHIYSFSHLTFQEYFTAREIILVRQSSDKALQELVSHLFEPRWREVFLLAVAMSPNAEKLVLLMKEKIDSLLAEDTNLQKYLQWLNEKAQQNNTKITLEEKFILRGNQNQGFYVNKDRLFIAYFYFNLDFFKRIYFKLDLDLDREIDFSLNGKLSKMYDIEKYFDDSNKLDLKKVRYYFYRLHSIYHNISLVKDIKYYRDFYYELLSLQKRLPEEKKTSLKKYKTWWKNSGKVWIDDFRQAIIKYRNIGHDWQFSEAQKEKLKQYYYANKFLTQCLHQDCYVSPEVRQYIEETLLLPMAEIKSFASNV